MKILKYCESVAKTKRWKTREVMVGNVGVGGDNPVRIQSMTTSSTCNVEETIGQICRLADYGCEIARVTVQGKKEAEACGEIKEGLVKKGYDIPLVADIHFYPPAAMRVVDFVDKVRINPGNFVDKRAVFETIEYTDASYAREVEKIREKFIPLVEKCKRLKRAMRIGTNHGSLSDRIMNRYGDTPAGMVESAFEFGRICRELDYHDFMFSMKASNPICMIQAYRLLVAQMMKEGWDYPLHLGVTEAGEGEDGRVKSAIGSGSLLLDGLGDTLRISLTEDPWEEIDPCKRLIAFSSQYEKGKGIPSFEEQYRDIAEVRKREVEIDQSSFLNRDGSVILRLEREDLLDPKLYEKLGYRQGLLAPEKTLRSVDAILLEKLPDGENERKILDQLEEMGMGVFTPKDRRIACITSRDVEEWEELLEDEPLAIFLAFEEDRLHNSRYFFDWIERKGSTIPVILDFAYECDLEDLVIAASAECGALLGDGLGEGICISGFYSIEDLTSLSLNILQGARMRTFKTEFISCPGCGRTLFDLQEVTKKIRARVAHLPGVKIAIMGCIVNGPGEMADADFGYVGSAPGKIDLYVKKERVEKNIPSDEAGDRLIELIKEHGRWVEPELEEVYI